MNIEDEDVLYCSNCHAKTMKYIFQKHHADALDIYLELSLPTFGDHVENFHQSSDSTEKAVEITNDNALEVTTISNVVKVKRSDAFEKMYQKSRKDWDLILCNGMESAVKFTRARRNFMIYTSCFYFHSIIRTYNFYPGDQKCESG